MQRFACIVKSLQQCITSSVITKFFQSTVRDLSTGGSVHSSEWLGLGTSQKRRRTKFAIFLPPPLHRASFAICQNVRGTLTFFFNCQTPSPPSHDDSVFGSPLMWLYSEPHRSLLQLAR